MKKDFIYPKKLSTTIFEKIVKTSESWSNSGDIEDIKLMLVKLPAGAYKALAKGQNKNDVVVSRLFPKTMNEQQLIKELDNFPQPLNKEWLIKQGWDYEV